MVEPALNLFFLTSQHLCLQIINSSFQAVRTFINLSYNLILKSWLNLRTHNLWSLNIDILNILLACLISRNRFTGRDAVAADDTNDSISVSLS